MSEIQKVLKINMTRKEISSLRESDLKEIEILFMKLKSRIENMNKNYDTKILEEFLISIKDLITQGKSLSYDKAYYYFMAAKVILDTLERTIDDPEITNRLWELRHKLGHH